jgi:hypothetical protein
MDLTVHPEILEATYRASSAYVEPAGRLERPTGLGDWRVIDTIGEAAFAASLLADRYQTYEIAERSMEANVILGRSPTRRVINNYFGLIMAAHMALAPYVPARWRPAFQWIPTLVQVRTIARNARIETEMHQIDAAMIRFKFPGVFIGA